jgi:hypothetical protein
MNSMSEKFPFNLVVSLQNFDKRLQLNETFETQELLNETAFELKSSKTHRKTSKTSQSKLKKASKTSKFSTSN